MASGIMEVAVLRARGLKSSQLCGKLDPYILVQYKDQQHKSTRIKNHPSSLFFCFCHRGKGSNPKWKQTFKFNVEESSQRSNERHKLVIRIMDHDAFTEHDYLGEATIYLKELIEMGMESGQAELPPQKYRVVSGDQSYGGEIQVGVTFTADVTR